MSRDLGLPWEDDHQILPYRGKRYADLTLHKSGQSSKVQVTWADRGDQAQGLTALPSPKQPTNPLNM